MAERCAILAVLLAIAVWGSLRPAEPVRVPPLVPAEQAQAWMVDALPGVGPLRRAAALDAVQAEAIDRLPKQARATARQVFSLRGGR